MIPSASDTAELLTRIHASEPDAGLHLYDRFADRIHDLVLFLTRDGGMAAETTRDVIVMTAQQDAEALSDPATLRAWLYAQARNETFALLSTRGRTPAADRVVEVPALPDAPTTADLGALVWTAMAAFSERDQALVTLHLRHGLEGDALADAMGLSRGAVDVLLPPTLERVETQIAALLVLATGQVPEGRPELAEVSAEWDGMFSPMVRGRVATMLQDSGAVPPVGTPGPMSLLQTIPLCPAPASLREAVAERLAVVSRLGPGGAAMDPEIDDTIPPGESDALGDPTPAGRPAAEASSVSAEAPVLPADAVGAGGGAGEVTIGAGSDGALREDEARVAGTQPSDVRRPVASVNGSARVRSAARSASPATGPLVAEAAAPRTPLPLALALGIAVGLVIAAALVRIMSGDVAPAQVTDVVSTVPSPPAAAGAAAPEEAPTMAAEALAAAAPGAPLASETPGRLSVPGDDVVVGHDGPTALRLTNSGGAAIDWRIVSLPEWVTLDRLEGAVDPGATVEIQVTYAAGLAEGDYVGDVTVEWMGAEIDVAVARLTGAVDRVPELQNLRIGSRELSARGCGQDQTEVEVLVADESPIAQVLVTTTGPGPETQTQFALAADPAQPGRFVGVVGPFDIAGDAALEIEATDARGNRAAAVGGRLSVAPLC